MRYLMQKYAHFLSYDAQNPVTQLANLRSVRRIILFNHLPRRPAEIYPPLLPCRTLKDRDSDMVAYPLSELTL